MNLKFIGYLSWTYGFRAILRGPSYIIASLSSPLTLLFIVYILSKGTLLKFALVGGFIGLVASVALSSSGDAAFMRLQLRMQDLLVPSKVKPSDYMIGLTLSYFIFSLPGLVLYGLLGWYFKLFTPLSALLLVIVMLILVIATSSVSFIVSGTIKHVRNVWGIAGIMSVVMTVLPPTFYPYTYLPSWALIVLSVTPVTPAAIVAQGVFGLQPILINEIYVLLAETVVFFSLARYLTRWREV
ncbi:MAG TPA: ABC transporter permease [Thermoplasmataceae archaeon]|nr:ABC transporter permease [Thermoplasmatales archaeon AK]HLH85450.1 ABC transporter permease [Thermoplasmataceae archaeon]